MYAYRKNLVLSLILYYQSCFLHQKEDVLARGGSSDIADTDTDRSIQEELSAQWIGGREYSEDQDARYTYFHHLSIFFVIMK